MSKLTEAQEILKAFGLPRAQQNEIAAYTLLALSNIKKTDNWKNATKNSLGVSEGVMSFVNKHYKKNYAPNTRETFRRNALHQFVQARIADYNPDIPDLAVNSSKTHYALTNEALNVIKTFKTSKWEKSLKVFSSSMGKLTDLYTKKRELTQIPITVAEGKVLKLSAGKHNVLQAAVIKEFASRFANGGSLLYLGDTAQKDLHVDEKTLKELNIPIDQHSKLPDVIIYDSKRDWLFLIEAVTTHGPVSGKRIVELEKLLNKCKAGKIYVTAFLDMDIFKKYSKDIAWETDVWIADEPDHLIHFNGDKFMGPR